MFSCDFAAYLQNCCTDEHLFGNYFCKFLFNKPAIFFNTNFSSNLDCFIIYFLLVQCSPQNAKSFVFRNFLCSYLDSLHVNSIFCFVGLSIYKVVLDKIVEMLLELRCSFLFREIFLQKKLVLLLIFDAFKP